MKSNGDLIREVRAHVDSAMWAGVDSYSARAEEPAPSGSAQPEHSDKRRKLDELYAEFKSCHKCALGETRTNFVFGVGSADARLMFIGEAPGEEEDLRGEPFVGRAGQLLTKMITAMGLRREDVYIANILKCRPPANRKPTLGEMEVCMPYLLRQIEVIRPEIIVALGATAVQGLLDDEKIMISKIRGKFIDWHGIKLMPTFHPSYLLRAQNEKAKAWADLQLVMQDLGLGNPKA